MNNKIVRIIGLILIIISIVILSFFGVKEYKKYLEKKRIENAIIKIDLVDNLDIEFNDDVYIMDLIESINGVIINNDKIDTSSLGKKVVKFKYINEENIKVPYEYVVNVKDMTPPVIWLSSTYTVKKGYKNNLLDVIMCGDNYDDRPVCTIEGEYDTSKVGDYKLLYKAVDTSGNASLKNFTLKVVSKTTSSSSSTKKVYFKDAISKYKNEKTKIGIDVSKWQGDINYQKVKDDGVEFVFIKVGGTNGINGDYYVDPKFEKNIKGFNEVGIPVGVYFYSYANSKEKAINDAKWVIEQIKDYKIDLPIAYDWENWSYYNKFGLSFYNLTNNAISFIDTINKHNYQGILYSSKSYLESIWLKGDYPVWLAHYTTQTDYDGEYQFWQRCSTGIVDGITANTVDIDIMYLK